MHIIWRGSKTRGAADPLNWRDARIYEGRRYPTGRWKDAEGTDPEQDRDRNGGEHIAAARLMVRRIRRNGGRVLADDFEQRGRCRCGGRRKGGRISGVVGVAQDHVAACGCRDWNRPQHEPARRSGGQRAPPPQQLAAAGWLTIAV